MHSWALILIGILATSASACGKLGEPRPVAASLAEVKVDDLLSAEQAAKLIGKPVTIKESTTLCVGSRVFNYLTSGKSAPAISVTICPEDAREAFDYLTRRHYGREHSARQAPIPCKAPGGADVCVGWDTTIYMASQGIKNPYLFDTYLISRDNLVNVTGDFNTEDLAKKIASLLPKGKPPAASQTKPQ